MADDSNTSATSEGSSDSDKNSLSSYLPTSAATKSSRTRSRNSGSEAKKLTGSLKVSWCSYPLNDMADVCKGVHTCQCLDVF